MPQPRAFISQARPSPAEVEWARQFAAALRSHGFDTFQEWSHPDSPSPDIVEQALRESDLIVLVLDDNTVASPTFYFEFGVAVASDKGLVVVIPPNVEPSALPLPLRRGRYIQRASPAQTANIVAAESRQRQPA